MMKYGTQVFSFFFLIYLDVLRRNTNKSFCEEDQRLGATIAVNRQFSSIMYNTATVPMVTVSCFFSYPKCPSPCFADFDEGVLIIVCLRLP